MNSLVEMSKYAQPPDTIPGKIVETTPLSTGSVVAKNPAQKLSFITKLLIVACIGNFVLLVLSTATLSFLLTRTAAKSEVGASK
jgi:hypothetical protein